MVLKLLFEMSFEFLTKKKTINCIKCQLFMALRTRIQIVKCQATLLSQKYFFYKGRYITSQILKNQTTLQVMQFACRVSFVQSLFIFLFFLFSSTFQLSSEFCRHYHSIIEEFSPIEVSLIPCILNYPIQNQCI